MKGYNHITDSEQRRIGRLLEDGVGVREIARRLHRGVGTISEEITRNKANGVYDARKAKHKARVRRQKSKIQCLKVAMDEDLKQYVAENIVAEQSPSGISGRIKKVDQHIKYASPKAIYKFVYSVHGRKIEKHLYSKAVHKKGGPKRNRPVTIDGRTTIDQRPKEVDKRLEFGHFEGDFIESGKDGKGSLLVLVERKTRYPFLVYTESKKTDHINKLVASTLKDSHVESITLDNDLSFQKHKELAKLIDADVFFCHIFCSHEKGTVENRNKAIRRDVKKKSDLSSYPLEHFKMVEQKLRNKFMTCLNYKTPQEVWNEEMEDIKNKKTPQCGIINQTLKINSGVRLQG